MPILQLSAGDLGPFFSSSSCDSALCEGKPQITQTAQIISGDERVSSRKPAGRLRPADTLLQLPHKKSTAVARGRADVPNYSNEWAGVAVEFTQWAAVHGRMRHDTDSLKKKFDKIASMKKNWSLLVSS
eukprot:IDg19361t1